MILFSFILTIKKLLKISVERINKGVVVDMPNIYIKRDCYVI